MDRSKRIHVRRAVFAFAAAGLAFSSDAKPGEGAEVQVVPSTADHFVVEHDADVAIAQDGPHDGGGPTTGHSFFQDEKDLEFVFRKRVLHPGSAIGLHVQRENEIYYVLSGSGRYTMDGEVIEVGPGLALLTRPGGSHALEQTGSQDLVLIIVYPRH
jgi:mannose-6-phosphate isomerase-like protein (cupin superfamily)